MASPLTLVNQRAQEDWLIGYSSQQLAALAEQRAIELRHWQTPPKILLVERDPLPFLAGFIAACSVPSSLFLANPDWGAIEWQQILSLVQPDVVWGREGERKGGEELARSTIHDPRSTIHIPTGGSSGEIRFATHTWDSLTASVQGFCQYFGVDRVNSCCVLPLYHVSGLMQFLRSFLSGGRLALLPFKSFASGELPDIQPPDFFLSLVPTQLHRLLHPSHPPFPPLSFHTILLGGAPAWSDLLEVARQRQIRLAPTYGMTETASQVATLKPEDFLAGKTGVGQVLPHAQIEIRSPGGENLAAGVVGVVTIAATSLALGYYPEKFDRPCWQPDDLGYLDDQGYLHIIGRQGDKIITGGENVFPAEVEAAIQATGLVRDVCVVGVDDRHWGQAIAAVYVAIEPQISPTTLQAALAAQLSKFKCPKHWLSVETLPRNAQGKINRQQVRSLLAQPSFATTTAVDPTMALAAEPPD